MRLLYITTVGGTMGFFTSLIRELLENGDTVDIAANITDSDVPKCYRAWNCKVYPLPCTRSPFDMGNLTAIKEIRRIVSGGNYDIVHCHTPIAAMCTRLACRNLRKKGVKVFYTAHGFHFYKGAPLKNWLLYYPVEWVCAFWTDVLITINKEDYARAKKHLHAKRVEYVPGVGIDLQKFAPDSLPQTAKEELRASIGVGKEDKLLLSVGELIERKNHETVICALAQLEDPHLKYCICGTGRLEAHLKSMIEELNLTDSVQLLGYRRDISELCDCADLFVFPSLQEGLPVALMEAIASRTPVICSNTRGNTDLVNPNALFDAGNTQQIAEKIKEYLTQDHSDEVEKNYAALKKFDLAQVEKDMQALYSTGGGVTYLERLFKLQQLRKSIGVPLDAVLIVSAGELNVNKNHEVVIRALARLGDASVHYAIAGSGSLREHLLDLAAELGVSAQVHLLGFRSDIPDLYHAADICAFPSIREGLGLAALEGMACGLPLICSDNRGTRDYAINGENAFVCKSHSADEFAAAVKTIAADEQMKKKMGDSGRRIVNHFRKENVNRRMKELYREYAG